ncbi:MAG: RNA-binding domain-containing protein [Methanocellales archaeon]
MKINLIISALVHPTESQEKVEAAIKKLFPNVELKLEGGFGVAQRLIGSASDIESLRKMHELLRRQKILDTARSTFLKYKRGSAIEFELNKQVAYVGKINFVEEPVALGSIHVKIESDEIDRLIDWLAPATKDGRPIQEIEL